MRKYRGTFCRKCGGEYLDGVEAAHDTAVLDFDIRRRVSKATLVVRPSALVAGELPADVQCQPTRVLDARSAGPDRSRRRRRRSGRRRRVDDRGRAQHRIDNGHNAGWPNEHRDVCQRLFTGLISADQQHTPYSLATELSTVQSINQSFISHNNMR